MKKFLFLFLCRRSCSRDGDSLVTWRRSVVGDNDLIFCEKKKGRKEGRKREQKVPHFCGLTLFPRECEIKWRAFSNFVRAAEIKV